MDKICLGTRVSFAGPLDLVQSIRIALGDETTWKKKVLTSVSRHPGDETQSDEQPTDVESNDNRRNSGTKDESNNAASQEKEAREGSAM